MSETDDLKPCDLATLSTFVQERVLMQSALTGSVFYLGTLHGEPAIVKLQRTAVDVDSGEALVKSGLESLDVYLENRPYFNVNAITRTTAPDLSIKLIWPATETHIKKHSPQPRRLLTETPEMYTTIVQPYIDSFPPERIAWVHAILNGEKEAERILFSSPGDEGFMLLPDLKWDGVTLPALYLTALVRDGSIRSIRDLKRKHIGLLKEIRRQAYSTVKGNYGVGAGELRLFVHYQPSYYHFHVHIVHVQHEVMMGMAVGQAHMLEDVINWLELSAQDGPSLPALMSFTYSLGTEHGLYAPLAAAQPEGSEELSAVA